MDQLEFSPEQQGRANAFVKAFSKKPVRPLETEKPVLKNTPVVKDPIPKPIHKSAIIDPGVENEQEMISTPKIAIGAEYNAIKIQENKEKQLMPTSHSHRATAFFMFLIFLASAGALVISLYTYDEISRIKQEQTRIISNQQIIFEKLTRLGQRRR